MPTVSVLPHTRSPLDSAPKPLAKSAVEWPHKAPAGSGNGNGSSNDSDSARETPATGGDDAVDFECLVGTDGWRRLAPDIRRRFSDTPRVGAPIEYIGVMQQVHCSIIGWVLAQACRVLGTPFATQRGCNVPVDITLRHDPAGGVVWERNYRFADGTAVMVSSTKRIDEHGALLECVGRGFGMRLAVFEANRALHFLSMRYYCTIGGRRLHLPHWLSPGTAHVVHDDLGDGRFRFTLSIHHPLFGTLFQQDGTFHRLGERG